MKQYQSISGSIRHKDKAQVNHRTKRNRENTLTEEKVKPVSLDRPKYVSSGIKNHSGRVDKTSSRTPKIRSSVSTYKGTMGKVCVAKSNNRTKPGAIPPIRAGGVVTTKASHSFITDEDDDGSIDSDGSDVSSVMEVTSHHVEAEELRSLYAARKEDAEAKAEELNSRAHKFNRSPDRDGSHATKRKRLVQG